MGAACDATAVRRSVPVQVPISVPRPGGRTEGEMGHVCDSAPGATAPVRLGPVPRRPVRGTR